MKANKDNALDVYKHANNNEIEILQSKRCHCLFCRHSFDSKKIVNWAGNDGSASAVCPECGMDAVVGDASGYEFTKESLKEVNQAIFGKEYMKDHPEAAQRYIERYENGKITHKKSNEDIYIGYLMNLALNGDNMAIYDLAAIYGEGTEFTERDPAKAYSLYMLPYVYNEPEAITRRGRMLRDGLIGPRAGKAAYELFAKSSVYSSSEAALEISDAYHNGEFVTTDNEFSVNSLYANFMNSYLRFIISQGREDGTFAATCLRIGARLENGDGKPKDLLDALRFYLMADFAYSLIERYNLADTMDKYSHSVVTDAIERLSGIYNFKKKDPVFDLDTFYASFGGLPTHMGRLDLFAPAHFKPKYFSPLDAQFEFEIDFAYSPLIVDIENLYCGFSSPKTYWKFQDVTDVDVPESDDGSADFSKIEIKKDTCCRLYAGDALGSGDLVVEMFLRPSPSDDTKIK